MRSKLFAVLMMIMLVFSMSGSGLASGVTPVEPLTPVPVPDGSMTLDAFPTRWFVELKSPPAVEGTARASLLAEQANFRNLTARLRIPVVERMAFSTLWNGFSVEARAEDIQRISRLPGVAAVYPVEKIYLDDADPQLASALGMTGADIAQSELGLTGAGVKVAVMDTGIDFDHPDLGGCFGPGCRVEFGYDFVGDDYDANPANPTYNPIPAPDPIPDDCNGHGTHVAGIVGANGEVVGVAPEVTFGAYRVFGCEGSTEGDIMIAAMEMALADGMDVLNMSIGSSFQWHTYPTAVAANNLVKAGMVVVASIGNSGANGLYSAGAPGVGTDVIGVASFDNLMVTLPYFTVNDAKIGYIAMTGSGPVPTSGTEEMVYVGLACNGMALLADPAGKVALADRGTCAFSEKALNAINAGATGVVVANNAPGTFSGTIAPYVVDVPVIGISLADGTFLKAQAAPVMMTWTDMQDLFPNPTGGLISSFSSYGLSPNLDLKPDIGAPGGAIYSTVPLEQGGYGVKGGTSMSSPHVAGAAALFLQAKPKSLPADVRTAMLNSADPHLWFGNPGLGFLDNVHRQGAGMLDIDDSVLAAAVLTPAKLALGEAQAAPFVRAITIKNTSKEVLKFFPGYVNALSTGGTITPSFFLSNAVVTFNRDSIAVLPGKSAVVLATITPATSPVNGQYGGYLTFTDQYERVLRVPFAGFVGDYQGIVHISPGAYGFPLLGRTADGVNFSIVGEGAVFSMVDLDDPNVLLNLGHQARRVLIDVFNATTGAQAARVLDWSWASRNSTTASFFAFAFDGMYKTPVTEYMVPDGSYYFQIKVLKALGDTTNPAHWETWTSPTFIIDRP